MPKATAHAIALTRARAALLEVELESRCPALGLRAPVDGRVCLRAFGEDMALTLADLALTDTDGAVPARTGDALLLLHYLQCAVPITPSAELCSFRDFAGGQFYHEPFRSRTTGPLVDRFGDDLEGLRTNLARFDTTPVSTGDVGARIHAFGSLHVVLIYHASDDEFPAAAELLFSTAVKKALQTEDAAVLASRICIGLL